MYTENDLWRSLLPVIKAGLAADYPDLAVRRAYQPGTQSDGLAPRLTLYRVGSRRYGFQGGHHRWLPAEGQYLLTEVWTKEDTYQASAFVGRAAADSGYTAKDVIEALAGYLQGAAGLKALRDQGLGILRLQDIQETPYEDEQNTYKINVSLRFVLTYQQSRESRVPAVTAVMGRVHRP